MIAILQVFLESTCEQENFLSDVWYKFLHVFER